MTAVTNFKAINSEQRPVLADAYGNNVAFQCLKCGGPVLATMMPNQRGSSVGKPAICRSCESRYWIEVEPEQSQLVVHSIPAVHLSTLKLGRPPVHTAPQNIASWSVVTAVMGAYGTAEYDNLVAAVRNHDHASGGKGFIDYCIKNEWLTQA